MLVFRPMIDPLQQLDPFLIPATTPIPERLAMLLLMARASRKTPEVQKLVKMAKQRLVNPSAMERASAALRVVQETTPYVRHSTPDQWFQPVWLTARRGGMCADLSALLSSVLCEMEVGNRLVWIDQIGAKANHLTVQVWVLDHRPSTDSDTDPGWQYADPSIPTAVVGETPYEALERSKAWDRVGK